jgi:hypothetical protein
MKPKVNQQKVDEIVSKIDNPDQELEWKEGQPKFKSKEKVKQGKASKAKGNRFELKVRKYLEENERFVGKWDNNVDLEKDKIIIAKRVFNPYKKVMTIGTGFPDFISFKKIHSEYFSIIGIEVKINGKLSKIEKEKCHWYIKKEIFSDVWIAKEQKVGKKNEIVFDSFKEKYIEKKQNK